MFLAKTIEDGWLVSIAMLISITSSFEYKLELSDVVWGGN